MVELAYLFMGITGGYGTFGICLVALPFFTRIESDFMSLSSHIQRDGSSRFVSPWYYIQIAAY